MMKLIPRLEIQHGPEGVICNRHGKFMRSRVVTEDKKITYICSDCKIELQMFTPRWWNMTVNELLRCK